ncbi:MAG: restriction endonuclease subunit S, partial [Chloroflexi bacterium]|nr:restriction endonuclease subunit S [Chloroflexota bacterium]
AFGKLEQLYLYYMLLSQNGQGLIHSKISGSAQPGLKRDFIKNFPVLIPVSTKEQSKIAEILTTVDRTISRTEELIAKHLRIKIGLMQDLLTRGVDEHRQLRDPSTHSFKSTPLGMIPSIWGVSTLAGITKRDTFICYGIVQPRGFFVGGVPVLAIKDMKGDYHTDIHLTDPAIDAMYVRSRVEPGDLLISVKGSTGVIDIVPEGFKGNISRDIAKVRLSENNDARFFRYYLESFQGQMALDLLSVGTTRKELSIAPLKNLQLPVPEKKEQEQIADILMEKDSYISSLREKHDKFTRIKAGLMQDLLNGRVSVMPLFEV